MKAAAAILLAILLVPSAAGSCVRLVLHGVTDIAWAGEETAIVRSDSAWAVHRYADGLSTSLGLAADEMSPLVASPDGAWIAWEFPLESEPGREWDCSLARPAVGARARDGPVERIDFAIEGEPRALAASATHLAVAFQGADNVTLVSWGDWNVSALRVDKAAAYARQGIVVDSETWNASDIVGLRFSHDGAYLAIASWNDSDPMFWRRDLTVVDAATGIPVDGLIGAGFERGLIDFAFHPNGTHLAVMTGDPTQFVEVRTHDLRTGAMDRWLGVEAGVALAWGPRGLAVALAQPPAPDAPTENGTLVLLDDALDPVERRELAGVPTAIAWANDTRIAIALGGRLELVEVGAPDAIARDAPLDERWVPWPTPLIALGIAAALASAGRGGMKRS